MIKLLAACILLFAALGLPSPARADWRMLSPGVYVAGVPTGQFEAYAAPMQGGRQRQSNWCWAASVQMVLNYHGLYVQQEEIVQRIYGGQVDQPAGPGQILTALSGWAPDARGGRSAIYASPYTFSGAQIVQDLAQRWPLIVGLATPGGGHAVVLTAVTYQIDQFKNPIFMTAIIRDPWPGSPSMQEIPWHEFQGRVMFMAHVYVQPL